MKTEAEQLRLAEKRYYRSFSDKDLAEVKRLERLVDNGNPSHLDRIYQAQQQAMCWNDVDCSALSHLPA